MNELRLILKPMDNRPTSFPMEWPLTIKDSYMLHASVDQKYLKLTQCKLFYYANQIERSCFMFTLLNCSKGKVLFAIPIPAKKVTSVAFGGPNLDILYVTTAAIAVSAAKIGLKSSDEPAELDGRLFKVTGLGAKGLPAVKVRV